MPTIKLELFKSKTLADGKHPVCIRVNHLKPVRKTIASAHESEWIGKPDKCLKGSTTAIRNLNIEIEDEYNKYYDRFKELVRSGKPWRPEDVFAVEAGPEASRKKTFWELADIYLNTLSGYTKASAAGKINKFRKFAKNDKLLLIEIDSKLIADYIHFMRTVKQRNGRPNKEGTIRSNMKMIRFVSTFASRNRYDTCPFDLHNFKLPKDEPAETEFLTEIELLNFAAVDVHEPAIKEAQQAFLLAVYLWGMRVGDVIRLKQEYFSGNWLKYTTGKTGKAMEIALVPKAQTIVNGLIDGREYLFHFYKFKYNHELSPEMNDKFEVDHIKSITLNINNALKKVAKQAGITKNIRSHIARHSFSNLLDANGVDLSIIQGLLGHGTREMTEKYIKKIRKSSVLNEAVKGVFG